MPRCRVNLLIITACAGQLACGAPAPNATPQPSSGAAGLTPESPARAATDVIMASFRWTVAHKPGVDQGAILPSIYGHLDQSRCSRPGCGGPRVSGPDYGVHSPLDGPATDSLAQRIERELHLSPPSPLGDDEALLYLTNLEVRGDNASAVITIDYGDGVAKNLGVDAEDNTCLTLTRRDSTWSVVGTHPWVRRLDVPAYQNVCR